MTLVPRPRRSSAAFTLLELMLALAILGIVLAVSIPNARGSLKRLALRNSVSTLAANLRYAQAKAVTESRTIRVVLDQAGGRYWLEAADETDAARFTALPGPAGEVFALPGGVSFDRIQLLAEDGATAAGALLFLPDGRGGRGRIDVRGAGGRYQLTLTGTLGEVLVSEGQEPFGPGVGS